MSENVISICLAADKVKTTSTPRKCLRKIFSPGEVVTKQPGFMRGHGTDIEDNVLKAVVAGILEPVNRLYCIKPIKSRYSGEIGDVVVGRITEVQQKRWKVHTNSILDSILLLSSVNLPGGEFRRRLAEDEQTMRKYLVEGDLISAEVQNVFNDGSLSLHTRSFKYRKLSQGLLVKVFPSLIRKSKTHFHTLPCGISVILGNNGFIWIYIASESDSDTNSSFVPNLEQVISKFDREAMARVRNCILALAASKIEIFDTSIMYAYDESKKYKVPELLNEDKMLDIAVATQNWIYLTENS